MIMIRYTDGAVADRWLTRTFHDPSLLEASGAEAEATFDRFRTRLDNAMGNECLLLGWKVKRTNLAVLFGMLSVLAVGVGVAVGMLSRSAALGAGIGGGLVSLLGVVLGLVLNMIKRDLGWHSDEQGR